MQDLLPANGSDSIEVDENTPVAAVVFDPTDRKYSVISDKKVVLTHKIGMSEGFCGNILSIYPLQDKKNRKA